MHSFYKVLHIKFHLFAILMYIRTPKGEVPRPSASIDLDEERPGSGGADAWSSTSGSAIDSAFWYVSHVGHVYMSWQNVKSFCSAPAQNPEVAEMEGPSSPLWHERTLTSYVSVILSCWPSKYREMEDSICILRDRQNQLLHTLQVPSAGL